MLAKLLTYYRLGIGNLFAVAFYRLALKAGYFSKSQAISKWPDLANGEFINKQLVPEVNQQCNVELKLQAFGWLEIDSDSPPNWLKAVNSNDVVTDNTMHWSEFNEFSLNIGDIKTIWELSRFDWAPKFAMHYLKSGDASYIEKLNNWLVDWCAHNPINQGVNWRCGQEASIRVMHVVTVIFLLNQQSQITASLQRFLLEHLKRISPTRFYAMGQDNNHGTSEACALFIGGVLLQNSCDKEVRASARKWTKQGRYWLENRANKLIAKDGLFSQFSVNYHRLMLDTLCLAEQVRIDTEQSKFTQRFYTKAKLASQWLFELTNPDSGDVPNIGANDGAQLLPITSCGYRDYRPTVQWAFGLFFSKFPYPKNTSYHELSFYMSPQNKAFLYAKEEHIKNRDVISSSLSTQVQKLTCGDVRTYVKTPFPTFRASSCDALHIDLWVGQTNLLRDAGSFSYNCIPELQEYFTSTQAHNTAQLDNREQMPRLSRFLYNYWIKTTIHHQTKNELSIEYQDHLNGKHSRRLKLDTNNLTVIDNISGFNDSAVIRWRLAPSNWQITDSILRSDLGTLNISADKVEYSLALVEGLESLYYLQKNTIPVLEVTLKNAGTIKTIINWF